MMEHLKALQKELAWFVLALVASALILGISHAYMQGVTEDKQAASETLDQTRAKYNLARDRKKMLEEFEKRYQQLANNGIVGEEDRLNWADLIENVTQKQGIPYVKYRIDKQERINDAGLTRKYPGIMVFKSRMTLEMQLLHEGDMYSLINALGDKAQGLFDVSECDFRRVNQNQVDILHQATDKNFNASCTLNWYTMIQGGTVNEEENQ
ncbi:MAG: hypothetical protein EP315_00040 [Gammaproteobacteria bacterium]|nr:MAG: hypothetical protein EP315_00040 [Gammaproteobacteria bacterium]